jgi:hypothetical protein
MKKIVRINEIQYYEDIEQDEKILKLKKKKKNN